MGRRLGAAAKDFARRASSKRARTAAQTKPAMNESENNEARIAAQTKPAAGAIEVLKDEADPTVAMKESENNGARTAAQTKPAMNESENNEARIAAQTKPAAGAIEVLKDEADPTVAMKESENNGARTAAQTKPAMNESENNEALIAELSKYKAACRAATKEAENRDAATSISRDEVSIKLELCKQELLTKILEEHISREDLKAMLNNMVTKKELYQLLQEKYMSREEFETKVNELVKSKNSILRTIAAEGAKAAVHEGMPSTMSGLHKGLSEACKYMKDLWEKGN